MPLFEFDCPECGLDVELLVRKDERPPCPQCSSNSLQKRISVVTAGTSKASLPVMSGSCPPPSAGPCGTGCCRLPK